VVAKCRKRPKRRLTTRVVNRRKRPKEAVIATQPIVRTPPARPAAKPEPAAAEVEPRAAMPLYAPTPSQHENDSFIIAVVHGTLPHTYSHAMDGSPIDPQSYDPTAKTSSFP
jgi:hypothetical protein